MHQPGFTRSVRRSDHMLQTPDTFVRGPLPGMHKATAIVHAAPAIGAAFTQYTVELDAGGSMAPSHLQRFVYVLDGTLAIDGRSLDVADFAYLPSGHGTVTAASAARALVIEKPYQPLEGIAAPLAFIGHEHDIAPVLLNDDPGLEVRSLIPDELAFDFRVNTLTYRPGVMLPMVEVHVMEHGLFMLQGGGIYRLGEHWYPVETGDFIYMAPYCLQWFGALGKTPASYLLYKDWARHPQ